MIQLLSGKNTQQGHQRATGKRRLWPRPAYAVAVFLCAAGETIAGAPPPDTTFQEIDVISISASVYGTSDRAFRTNDGQLDPRLHPDRFTEIAASIARARIARIPESRLKVTTGPGNPYFSPSDPREVALTVVVDLRALPKRNASEASMSDISGLAAIAVTAWRRDWPPSIPPTKSTRPATALITSDNAVLTQELENGVLKALSEVLGRIMVLNKR